MQGTLRSRLTNRRSDAEPQERARAVNVSTHCVKVTVIAGLLPLAYAAVLTCLLLQAFRMMRTLPASQASASNDRTGLKTTHPELLDENGEVTSEELWAVRFSDEGVVLPEA